MKNYSYSIGGKNLDNPLDPYIIAEIGVNHEGDMELAKRLILEAKEAGANAAKFQAYKAGMLASKESPAYWDTNKEKTISQYELFKKYDQFNVKDYIELEKFCKIQGIDFLSTPFDLDAVDFLTKLVPCFKIASADITNLPLIRKCSKTNKPLIISTGASTLVEIETAVNEARSSGGRDIALLHCVLNYPTQMENANLKRIRTLKDIFPDCVIGYSDHVVPDSSLSALEASVFLGACIIEKHFTHDKSLNGNDHYHSMDKTDLKNFVEKLKVYRRLVSENTKNTDNEAKARLYARRSIVAARNIKKGEMLLETDLVAKRPGHGISPLYWDDFIGKCVNKKIEEDQLFKWSDIG